MQIVEKPAIGVWVTDIGHFWISPTGSALPVTETPPPMMPRLVDPAMDAAVPGSEPGTAVDTKIVASALALMAACQVSPKCATARRSASISGCPGQRSTCTGATANKWTEKLEMLRLGRQLVATGELDGQILDVRFPDVVTTR